MDFNRYDLIDFLRQAAYSYKERGKELYFDYCPYCEKAKEKKSQHFSFNQDTGQFFCVKCQAKGNLITFKRDQGFEPFEYKVYHKPDQGKVKLYQNQHDVYYQEYQEKRGIPADILKKYGIGKTVDIKIGTCRTYPYIDETGEILNVKYINSKKEMRTESNAKRIYFGTQFLDYTLPYIHVVEGEDDCMALVAMGFLNVLSVPYGAGNYSEDMGQINKKFKTIWMLFDNDKAGQDGAKVFATKAGVWKCKNILLPFKDVRDCLLNGLDIFDIEKLKELAKQFDYDPTTKVRPALSLEERVMRFEADAKKNTLGIKFGFNIIDSITGGLRGGDLMAVVANPGCFKTTMLMNLIKRGIDNTSDGIAIFFSLEMQCEAEFQRELQIMFGQGQSYRMRGEASENTEEWQNIKYDISKSEYNRIWVVEETWLTIDDMIKTIKLTEEVSGKKCILCGVDYIDFVSTGHSKEYDAVKEVMMGLKKKIAKHFNIPVICLNQTNRESKQDDEEVGNRSGKGGTSIEATADFTIGLWRNEDRLVGRINKHRRFECNDPCQKEFPYLAFDLDKSRLTINSIIECQQPKKKRSNNGIVSKNYTEAE